MKKLLYCIMVLLLAMSSVSFTAYAEDSLTVVAATYPLYDMIKTIGGDAVNAIYAPDDASAAAKEADMLLCMGGASDDWADELSDVEIFKALDGMTLLDGEEDALTIPINLMLCAATLKDKLAELDERNAETYSANLMEYTDALIALDMEYREAVAEGMRIRCEDGSMAYFALEYGAECVSDDDSAVALRTYNSPNEAEREQSYLELMRSNLKALQAAGE